MLWKEPVRDNPIGLFTLFHESPVHISYRRNSYAQVLLQYYKMNKYLVLYSTYVGSYIDQTPSSDREEGESCTTCNARLADHQISGVHPGHHQRGRAVTIT